LGIPAHLERRLGLVLCRQTVCNHLGAMGLSLKKNLASPNANKPEARERFDEYRWQLRETDPEDPVLADETAVVQVHSRLRARECLVVEALPTRRRETPVAAMGDGCWPPGCLTPP
jgi:hypothetical protein